ncbi:MAG: SRPBCC family protein [Pirellula sp.]
MKIVLYAVAVIVGLLVGGVSVGLIEAVNIPLFGISPPTDMNDSSAMEKFVSGLPFAALVLVVIAWGVGSLTGSAVAKLMTPNRRNLAGVIVCCLLFLATLSNLFSIPHPAWMWVVGLMIVPMGGAIGLCLVASQPYQTESSCTVQATRARVFEVLANAEEYSKAVPGIQRVEFLSTQRRGSGTRIRETRKMHGQEATAELEVTEFVEGQRIRLVTVAAGTTWDTLFEVNDQDTHTANLKMTLLAIPKTLVSRLTTPLMLGLVRRGVESDMKAAKAYSEKAVQNESA